MKKQQYNLFGEAVESTVNDLIIIKSKNKKNESLSKEQIRFNKLVKKIEKLNKDIERKELVLEQSLTKHNTTIKPVKIEIAQSLTALAKKIHHFLQKFKYTNTQDRELSGLIINFLSTAFETIEPDDELRKLHDQYSFDKSYDEIMEEDMASQIEDLMEILEFQFDIELDRDSIPDMKTATQEEIAAFVGSLQQKIEAEQSSKAHDFNEQDEKRKTTKAQQKEAIKEKAAEALKKKSLRSLYLSLAKALHPDTGGTEMEVLKKQELMKQVTKAYDNKDLSSLLKLEIDWLRGEASHTGNIADKQLKIYNQVLMEQVNELEQKQFSMAANPRYFEIEEYCFAPAKDISAMLDEELKVLEVRLVDIQEDLHFIKNKKTLLEFLKTVKESSMQSVSFDLLDSLLADEDMGDFF